MQFPKDFSDITRLDEPLAPYTRLRVGGPAQYFVEPRSTEELLEVIRACDAREIAVRVLGEGSNLLIRDDGVSGVVMHLPRELFSAVAIEGTTVQAEAGAALAHVVSQTVRAGLGGLESLTGIPGTLGGAIHGNAGGKIADIGQFVSSVTVATSNGEVLVRREDELAFGYRDGGLDDLLILEATLELAEDDPAEITRRMRKIWITKQAAGPLGHQAACSIFKNPRGQSSGQLIDRAGLKGTRIGGAEISDRHANYIVASDGARADDVIRLIDLARSRVAEQFDVDLELELRIW